MTTKKTKTTTKIKTEKIDLEEVRKTKMFSCNLEIPGNMEKFFKSNKQHLVESIIPLAATMFSNEQACFFALPQSTVSVTPSLLVKTRQTAHH